MVVIMPLGGVNKETIDISIDDYRLVIRWKRGKIGLKDDCIPLKEDCYRWDIEQKLDLPPQAYFDKSAKDLNLAEAALLAGLPQAPSRYSPFGSNPEAAQERQAEVLRRMTEDGYITALEADQAKIETLNYALSRTEIRAPHFVFYVRDLLYENMESKSRKGGLRVYTSLDLELQDTAQATVSAEITGLTNYHVGNGAALITKPNYRRNFGHDWF